MLFLCVKWMFLNESEVNWKNRELQEWLYGFTYDDTTEAVVGRCSWK